MKTAIGILLLVGIATAATAKPTPDPGVIARVTPSTEDTAVLVGPVGAMLESDYFRAPRPGTVRRALQCRLQVPVFEKTRLANNCN